MNLIDGAFAGDLGGRIHRWFELIIVIPRVSWYAARAILVDDCVATRLRLQALGRELAVGLSGLRHGFFSAKISLPRIVRCRLPIDWTLSSAAGITRMLR